MKTVILAGGLGTRLMEETTALPKPMVEIGGKPILWHIMKIYQHYGFNDFVLCLGYKSHVIKEYFLNYYLYNSDVSIELEKNKVEVHFANTESFKVTLVETGLTTNTAGRIKQIEKYVAGETFMLTYGDGVSDVNLDSLIKFHKQKKKLATVTAVQVPSRFGTLKLNDSGVVEEFIEKPNDGQWINGGFFVLEPAIFKFLEGDMSEVQWENTPLTAISNEGELAAFKHLGFWKSMDALRDRIELEQLWNTGNAKWKKWP